jgi:hypothetical protein
LGIQPPSDEEMLEAVRLYGEHGTKQAAANAAGIAVSTFKDRLRRAAAKGIQLKPPSETMEGFEVTKVTTAPNGGQHVTQKKEHGETFEMPATHHLGKMTVQLDSEGRVVQNWIRAMPDQVARDAALRAVVAGLKEEIPRVLPTAGPAYLNDQLLNQFTITDLHMGMMAWKEETGVADYDLKIAEKLLIDWFSAAIAMSPNAKVAVFAQIGDFMHHDSHDSVTPAHRHVLDADSRLQKIIRVCIRVTRQIIAMLAFKHEHVIVIYADANHDPASAAFMRELLHSMYEDEPRVTIDNSPGTYYAIEHGRTGLFYHHGHKKNVANVADILVSRFREIYGRCLQCYAHTGHKHSDQVVENNLMKVEQHRTLAPPDSYGSNWSSGRDAKIITYHKDFGEVGRSIISPRMLAANDNIRLATAAAA